MSNYNPLESKNKIVLTRKELYDLVWAEPLTSLSKKYNISDTGLRNICKKMNIPLPKAGHWQKLKYNKRLKNQELPNEFSGKTEIFLTSRDEGGIPRRGSRIALENFAKIN